LHNPAKKNPLPLIANQTGNTYVLDLTGARKSDLLITYSGNKRMAAITYEPAASPIPWNRRRTSLLTFDSTATSKQYQFADINGDGLVDAIEIPNGEVIL
jgi:hypothetical protein